MCHIKNAQHPRPSFPIHRHATASAKTSQLNPASTGELRICDHFGIPGLGLQRSQWLDRNIENLETVEVIFGEKSPLIPN